tara:strand:+ start:119 stop:352 length:234 start_codon:yes stop_codon:yes gene_type:complete
MNDEELIDLAYATYGPYLQITDDLEIYIKSDDGGRHLDFFVSNRAAAQYLRESVPHTFEGKRTIIRYAADPKEEQEG